MTSIDLELEKDYSEQISKLKKELNAVILAHNYQIPSVQDIADFVGDSLELARKATELDCSYIVFCGVDFMAETAAIVNPRRIVLLPEKRAGCPMAEMIDVPTLLEWKEKYPKASVVCYVNSTAAVKAHSDICCTSANALKIVESLPNDEIIMIPDENLGNYVASKTRKKIITYPGFCVTHHQLSAEDIILAKKKHPNAIVLAHPECRMEVLNLSDQVLSTSQMLYYVTKSDFTTFLIATEKGILHRMRKENPDKHFYSVSKNLICPNMKMTTLVSVLNSMRNLVNVIKVPEDISEKAKLAIQRMLEVT